MQTITTVESVGLMLALRSDAYEPELLQAAEAKRIKRVFAVRPFDRIVRVTAGGALAGTGGSVRFELGESEQVVALAFINGSKAHPTRWNTLMEVHGDEWRGCAGWIVVRPRCGLEIPVKAVRSCPCCGAVRSSVALPVFEVLRDVYGIVPAEVRGLRKGSQNVSFVHGIGYDWIDADLLGGSGDGKARRRLEELGVVFQARRSKAIESVCGDCSF